MNIPIGRHISIIHRNLGCIIDEKLHKYSLNPTQMSVLLILYEKDGISQCEINKQFFMNKASVTKIIKHLQEENYVKKIVSEKDKRKNLIMLTKKSHEIFPEIRKIFEEIQNIFEDNLSDDQMKQSNELLKSISDCVIKYRKDSKWIQQEN